LADANPPLPLTHQATRGPPAAAAEISRVDGSMGPHVREARANGSVHQAERRTLREGAAAVVKRRKFAHPIGLRGHRGPAGGPASCRRDRAPAGGTGRPRIPWLEVHGRRNYNGNRAHPGGRARFFNFQQLPGRRLYTISGFGNGVWGHLASAAGPGGPRIEAHLGKKRPRARLGRAASEWPGPARVLEPTCRGSVARTWRLL